MRALKPTSNRGSQAPRGDGRRVASDRHLRRVRPRHGRACASVNATLNDAGSSRRGVEESSRDRESGVRSFTRSVRAQQPDAMLWGALESCPEGDDWKSAPHALCAMRRMCRAAQTRDINIRLPKSRVNLVFAARPSHQKAGHRAIAHVVPRAGSGVPDARFPARWGGGVVNARRPGQRPGRSGAKSIDDAEHGARLRCAMGRHSIDACERHAVSDEAGNSSGQHARWFIGCDVRKDTTTKSGMRAARSSCRNRLHKQRHAARPAMA